MFGLFPTLRGTPLQPQISHGNWGSVFPILVKHFCDKSQVWLALQGARRNRKQVAK